MEKFAPTAPSQAEPGVSELVLGVVRNGGGIAREEPAPMGRWSASSTEATSCLWQVPPCKARFANFSRLTLETRRKANLPNVSFDSIRRVTLESFLSGAGCEGQKAFRDGRGEDLEEGISDAKALAQTALTRMVVQRPACLAAERLNRPRKPPPQRLDCPPARPDDASAGA
jgi:hypothetical protein